MKRCNVGWVERTVRVLVGLPTATSYLYVRHFSRPWSYGLLIGGLALTMTAAVGWCPIHRLFGISTAKRPEALPVSSQEIAQ